jgi:hypothetical protein
MALGEGVLEDERGCFRMNGHLLVWPESFSLQRTDEGVAIAGDGWLFRAGSQLSVAGGEFDGSTLPSLGDIPCEGPYVWVSEVSDVRS